MIKNFNIKTVTVTQSLNDFGMKIGCDGKLVRLDGSRIKKNAAFKEWIYKLRAGERLPRGRYFKNKRAGKPFIIIDEFTTTKNDIHNLISSIIGDKKKRTLTVIN